MVAVKLWIAWPPKKQQREQRQRHRDVGDDRARQRRIDRDVQQVRHRHPLVAPQHLADAVVDDDGVVERIAENGQQRRDAGQVEVDLRQRHESDRQHEIVDVGDHRAERELPFEPEPEVDQDAEDREHQADACRRRATRSRRAGRPPRRAGIRRRRRAPPRPSRPRPAAPPRRPAAAACGSARRSARRTAAAAPRRGRAPLSVERILREIGRPGLGLHLHQRAADEVDAEIQPVEEVQQRSPAIDSTADIGKLMRRKRMKSNLVSSGTMRRRRMWR